MPRQSSKPGKVRGKAGRTARRTNRKKTSRKKTAVSAASTIRQIGDLWAQHWNAGELEGVVAAYAEDAVYLPPHHQAVHGRDAIREYVKGPLGRGVSDLV